MSCCMLSPEGILTLAQPRDSHHRWSLAAQGTHCFLFFLIHLCNKSSMISEVKAGDKQTLKKKKKMLPKQNSCWRHKPKPILFPSSAAKLRVCLSLLRSLQWLHKKANLICVNKNWGKYKENKICSFFIILVKFTPLKKFFPLLKTIKYLKIKDKRQLQKRKQVRNIMEILTWSYRAAKKDFLDWWQVVWAETFWNKSKDFSRFIPG